MSTFDTYSNMSVYIPECLRSLYTRISAFHLYTNVYILRIPECRHLSVYIPECLRSMYTRMFAFHLYSNVCIPCIPECLHSMHTRMSTFHLYPNVCIPCIPKIMWTPRLVADWRRRGTDRDFFTCVISR